MFKLKSVLNTDSYDRRKYAELKEASRKLTESEQAGSQILPTFPHLLGDTWAGLFKNSPKLVEDVPEEVKPHIPLMDNLLSLPEFQAIRQYIKLDELASALGAVQMADRLNDLIKEQKEDMP